VPAGGTGEGATTGGWERRSDTWFASKNTGARGGMEQATMLFRAAFYVYVAIAFKRC